jgi:hypothetical protein
MSEACDIWASSDKHILFEGQQSSLQVISFIDLAHWEQKDISVE